MRPSKAVLRLLRFLSGCFALISRRVQQKRLRHTPAEAATNRAAAGMVAQGCNRSSKCMRYSCVGTVPLLVRTSLLFELNQSWLLPSHSVQG